MPKIEIAGEAEVFVRAGSTVRVTCVITQALEEPAYIFWYHNGARVLDYDRAARDIRMERRAPDTTVRPPPRVGTHSFRFDSRHQPIGDSFLVTVGVITIQTSTYYLMITMF